MDERTAFIADYKRHFYTFSELCRRFGVSRKTGYKWIARYDSLGPAGLSDQSRRPRSCPHETSRDIVEAIVEARLRHPTWGAKKLLALLRRRDPAAEWPARSTVCDLLLRRGLVPKKRRRRKLGHPGRPNTPMRAPNEIWTADFKGHFRTLDGRYCYPLTVMDGFSRYMLGCQTLLSPSHSGTKKVFHRLFDEFGLPRVIRTDNGAPFASTALGRLSRLSVWWIRLGVFPELIEPASPQQNGSHERFHRTLKKETTRPPAGNAAAQQRRFNRFGVEYNTVRPHEALSESTPQSLYTPSARQLPRKVPKVEYPSHYEVRRVSRNGGIRWKCSWVNVSTVLEEEYVGLEEVDDGRWDVYFGPVHLGRLDETDFRIEDSLGRKARKPLSPMSPD